MAAPFEPARIVSPQVFLYRHVFQRGELPIYITDAVGNPVDPAGITYTLFTYPAGNPYPVQVGPADRPPVHAKTGEYYVSGVAAEGGTTGDWYVRWHYQETLDSPTVETIFPFKVVEQIQPSGAGVRYGG